MKCNTPQQEREREREKRGEERATLIVSCKHHIGGVVEEEY
jgi:hypothetical protein